MLFCAGCSTQSALLRDVSVADAEVIVADEDVVIVDVREKDEYCSEGGHVPGALNYPWSSGYFEKHYTELSKGAELLVVCRSGRRSKAACELLSSKGYMNVTNMLGGTNQWIKDGHATEKCQE